MTIELVRIGLLLSFALLFFLALFCIYFGVSAAESDSDSKEENNVQG